MTYFIGWGKEDVDLYTKFIKNKFQIIRSRSPHLTHIFHHQNCSDLQQKQYEMCLKTKLSTVAPKEVLYNFFLAK